MQVNHPRNSVFIVPSTEDIFSCPRASLEKTALQLIDLLFDLIDLGPFSLHTQLLLLLVALRDFLPKCIFFFLSLLKELIIFQVPVALHVCEFSDKIPCPKLVILYNFIRLVYTLNNSSITIVHNSFKFSLIWLLSRHRIIFDFIFSRICFESRESQVHNLIN